MEIPFKELDLIEVLRTTSNQKEWFERQVAMVNDVRKTGRQNKQECQVCFYSMKVGGAAMTSSKCGICQTILSFGSTNVDRVCMNCATKHRLCKHCGGDIEFKQRRKL